MRYPKGGTRGKSLATTVVTLAFFVIFFRPVHAAGPIIINEIMWDGVEYVELFNTTSDTVSLAEWSLTRQAAGSDSKTIITFTDEDTVSANGFFLIEKNEDATTLAANKITSSLTLLNTGEQLQLLDAAGTVVDTANQLDIWFAGENTDAGAAMERTNTADGTVAGNWHTASSENHGRTGTPGLANSVSVPNAAPEAIINGPTSGSLTTPLVFTAEDSTDPEAGTLTYTWSFGDGTNGSGVDATHTYSAAGNFTVRLTVSDGELEDEATLTIAITTPVYSDKIVINELLPNPVGSDTTSEFIELKNTGTISVDLTNWQLDDEEGGSTPFRIPAATIAAGSLKLFMRSESKLALNNDGDTVRLIDPAGFVRAQVAYDDSLAEGTSYNLPVGATPSATAYLVSTTATPGAANIITQVVEEEANEAEDDDAADSDATTASTRQGRVAGTTTVTSVPLADVRDEDVGTMLQTEGVVSVPPGVLGKNIFYLAGSGIQVYSSKGLFPALKLGDKIKMTGELSSNRGEARLKVAGASDITTLATGVPPLPHRIETGAVDEDLEGSLVIVQGEVVETSGATFFIDDGSGEIKIVIGEVTKIDKPAMKKGTAVTITGIVSETTTGYRILPRFQEDVRLGLVAGLTSFPATGSRKSTGNFFITALVGLAIVLLWYGQRRGETLLARLRR